VDCIFFNKEKEKKKKSSNFLKAKSNKNLLILKGNLIPSSRSKSTTDNERYPLYSYERLIFLSDSLPLLLNKIK
jgi:hypothetical protein